MKFIKNILYPKNILSHHICLITKQQQKPTSDIQNAGIKNQIDLFVERGKKSRLFIRFVMNVYMIDKLDYCIKKYKIQTF